MEVQIFAITITITMLIMFPIVLIKLLQGYYAKIRNYKLGKLRGYISQRQRELNYFKTN